MRTFSSLLVGLCLLTGASCAGRSRLPAREANPQWEITGYGENTHDAEQQALTKASQSVAEYLEKNHPAVAWTPPVSYLQQRDIVRRVSEPTTRDLELSGRIVAVRYRVEITPELLREAPHLSRQQRMQERQRSLALGLAGAVAGLLVLGGYLRLEEATRGYYTRVLRLTAAGLLTVAGMGLWLLR